MTSIYAHPANLQIRTTKYQHLLAALDRHLTAATNRQDKALIAQLQSELTEIQAELRENI